MKKGMFNDRYGLTNAVIGMHKTQTRRVEPDTPFENVAEHADSLECEDGYIVAYYDGREVYRHKCNYKVGEVVAVAQRYSELYPPEHTITFRNANGINIKARLDQLDGWRNKMYVLSDLMPYRIRITGVKAERLQDISEEDCMKEGIKQVDSASIILADMFYFYCDYGQSIAGYYKTAREAFADLIDKVMGKGTWKSNPWVLVYEFTLIQ